MTDPNLPEQQPGTPVPPASQPAPANGAPAAPAYGAPPAAPAYGAPAAPAYGQPAPGYGQPAGAKTNTLAIVALVASLAGLVTSIGFVVGVICGHISLSQIKKTGEQGRGMAVAGLVVGYIGIALSIIAIIVVIAILASLAASGNLNTMY